MPDDISATGWLVVLCALALGFGLVKFLIVESARPRPGAAAAAPRPWQQVLGLADDASRAQIDAAYADQRARLAAEPLVELGAEFAQLAAQKLRELDAAYEAACAARG